MAWQFSTNNTPATGAAAIYLLKAKLKAAGWLVKSSSDGTTYNATADQITTDTTGAGGMANNRAWFRIQDPGALREFTFQRSASDNLNWRIVYSKAAKFTTGSPSATVVPSASDGQCFYGSGSDGSPGFNGLFGADGGYRFSCAAQSAAITVNGVACYPFYSLGFNVGGSNPTHGILCDVMDPALSATFNVDDTDPVLVYASGNGAGNVFMSEMSNQLNGYTCAVSPAWQASGFGAIASDQLQSFNADPSTGKDGNLVMLWVQRVGSPRWFKGYGTTAYHQFTARATGTPLSQVTTNDRIVAGYVSLPWDGSTPTV